MIIKIHPLVIISTLLLTFINTTFAKAIPETKNNESESCMEVQFVLPGQFVAPFDYLNNIPETGLDIDDDGNIDIILPCSCRLENPIPNGTNANTGIFDNQMIIATGVSGQQWVYFLGENILYPSNLSPIGFNTLIPEIGNTGVYVLPFAHRETAEYRILVKELSDPNQIYGPLKDQCFYPDPDIANLDNFYCDDEENISLLGLTTTPFDGNNVPIFGTETWTITRQSTGQTYYTGIFSPMNLGEGIYTVKLNFDLGNTAFAATHKTGCERTVEMEVEIRHAYPMACHNQISVSIPPNNCEIIIAPGHLLAAQPDNDETFTINIFTATGIDLGDTIPATYVGETLTGFVTDNCSGIFCSTTITVFDYVDPEINIPPDTTIICTGAWTPAITGFATGTDCTDISISYTDDWQGDECGDPVARIFRTWQVVDLSGNQTTAVQTISIGRGTQEELRFPIDVDYECTDWLANPSITLPEHSGLPTFVEESLCGIIYTYGDEMINLCDGNPNSFAIIRSWTVLDACGITLFETDGAGNDNIQFIRIRDTTAPDVSSPDLTISANIAPIDNGTENCSSMGFIPPPLVMDECSDYSISIHTPLGELIYANGVNGNQGGTIPAPGLPLGTFTITYEVSDICGNGTFKDVNVEVIDDVTPIMICDDNLTVSLTSNGFGLITAESINEGVRDDCCLDQILIKLEDESDDMFRTEITFFCTNDTVEVITRAWDCAGNFNSCQSSIIVNDLISPQIEQTVQDVILTCQADFLDYLQADFDAPEFSDNCDFTVSFTVEEQLNSCNIGTLTRTWTAMDIPINTPAIVTQTITLAPIHNYTINLPADETPECAANTFLDATYVENACDMMTSNVVQDTITDNTSGACMVIQRTFSLINWCEYDGQSTTFNLPRLTGLPQNPMPAAAYAIISDGDRVFRQTFGGPLDIGASTGNYTYVQLISIFDDEIPQFESLTTATSFCVPATETTCEAAVTYGFTVVDNCVNLPEVSYSININNTAFEEDALGNLTHLGNGNYQITGTYPLGQHQFFITYGDNCVNTANTIIDIEVVDCTPPVLNCLDSLAIEVELNESTQITVNELIINNFDNCGDLSLSFDETELVSSLSFDCDNRGDTLLTVWATDEAGHQSNCSIQILIDNTSLSCYDFFVVDGYIRTEEGEPIKEVVVSLVGEITLQTTTDTAGYYRFEDVLEGQDYAIMTEKDFGDDLNGITTFDIVLIQKHVLSVQPLTSPYKIIAADVNHTDIVSTFDILRLRKLILGVIPELESNTSWRFVKADYVFNNPLLPLEENFPENISIQALPGDISIDITGIKIGDANNTVDVYE